MMIVQAAKAYHVLGGRGGKHPNPNVAIAAGNVVNEGLKWLQGQDAAFQTDYWEARVQVQATHRQPTHLCECSDECMNIAQNLTVIGRHQLMID